MRKTSDPLKIDDILQDVCEPSTSKIIKVMKQKKILRNCHRSEETRVTGKLKPTWNTELDPGKKEDNGKLLEVQLNLNI
jgi:hypothetical protein